jgi:ABC-type transport system involved in multi-copper enzyme maturation permease subunit
VFAGGLIAAITSFSQSNAAQQLTIARYSYDQVANPDSIQELCDFLGEAVGPRCDAARRQELRFEERLLRDTTSQYELAAAMQSPLGVGGVAAGLVASLVGIVVLAAIGASHVAGEWTVGTIKPLLARDPRRSRFVLVKFLSVCICGVAVLVVVWSVLAALGPFFRHAYSVPPAPSSFNASTYTLGQVSRALVVIVAISALVTMASVTIRSPLGSFGLAIAIVVSGLVATGWQASFRFAPGYWIGAWMRFRADNAWADHVWVDRFPLINPRPGFEPDPAAGLIGLICLTAIGLVIALISMRVRDIGGG